MKNTLAINSFIVFSIIYLLIILLGQENMAWYLKPFLLPFLLAYVFLSKSFSTKKLLLTALAFSWMGDIVLMFAHKAEIYFILGLLLFLVSHIFYIILFYKQKPETTIPKGTIFLIASLFILVYLVAMLYLLFPKLGPLKIPVTVYAITISTMLYFALKYFFSGEGNSKFFVLAGAISFVCSDSLLAINKFYAPIHHSSFWIMITYLIAQACITFGIIRKHKSIL